MEQAIADDDFGAAGIESPGIIRTVHSGSAKLPALDEAQDDISTAVMRKRIFSGIGARFRLLGFAVMYSLHCDFLNPTENREIQKPKSGVLCQYSVHIRNIDVLVSRWQAGQQ